MVSEGDHVLIVKYAGSKSLHPIIPGTTHWLKIQIPMKSQIIWKYTISVKRCTDRGKKKTF